MKALITRTYNSSIDTIGHLIGSTVRRRTQRSGAYFPFLSQLLSRVPFAFGWKLRRAVFARILPQIGTDVVLHCGVTLEDARTKFGSDIWVSVGCYIDYAIIEDHVLIGQHAVLLAGRNQHVADRIDIPIKHQGSPPAVPITIGRGAWIGANSTVMADVGHDAIVGAGAVVTKPVPPFAVVAGNPARIIRMRNSVKSDSQIEVSQQT